MTTPIRISSSSLREGRWYEYVIRFALGGAATVFTGIISSRYGASVGGLFLALPAIFCASATLIEKHEIRRKRETGLSGVRRGQEAAALDAAGAALGALGMLAFAGVFLCLVERSVVAAFAAASLAWIVVSGGGLVRSAEAKICPAGCPGDERLCDAAKTLVLIMGPVMGRRRASRRSLRGKLPSTPFDPERFSAGLASPRGGVRTPRGIKLGHQLTLSAGQVRLCS